MRHLLFLATLSACSGGTSDTDTDLPVADADVDIDTDLHTGPCGYDGFDQDKDTAYISGSDRIMEVNSPLGTFTDFLRIDLRLTQGADPGAHVYQFTGQNYSGCHTCMRLSEECSSSGVGCVREYIVESGTMEVTSNGDAGDTLSGTLTNIVLIESTIDLNDTLLSTPVGNGREWCIDSMSFSAEIGGG